MCEDGNDAQKRVKMMNEPWVTNKDRSMEFPLHDELESILHWCGQIWVGVVPRSATK